MWIAYLMLDTCHNILSVFLVAVLQTDEPEEWQLLISSSLEAHSIGRFRTWFWHKLTTPSCIASGRQITRIFLRMGPGSRVEKRCIALWTFLVSASCHTISDWQAGEMVKEIEFFLASFALGIVELHLVKVIKGLLSVTDRYRHTRFAAIVLRVMVNASALGIFF
ncbi:hypothetical protein FB567DRAFT_516414 [Paraphoma chrysanthemicola]|uniref:Wax synthase domain-containing protein n=1 Tax=Paraphoma chrysanthemicola TaxID=798071 RepID=A0A8K0W2J5_9PLEO|nr:hypothetical protein FB567DRAFT_516414 [Paraphoma chrysanthemicola]